MFVSSIDNKIVEIKNQAKVKSGITTLNINGPYLELEGYASVEGINTVTEERIRKTLLLMPKLNIDELRQKNPELIELTDEEILEQKMFTYSLDNCKLSELKEKIDEENQDDLSGFKAVIDFSLIDNNKPLPSGEYDVYIRLEQMLEEQDDIKYEKIIAISDIKKFMESELLITKLHYFSSSKVLKYNLIISFNTISKTLQLKNKLLQSFDPRKGPEAVDTKENKYILAFKKRFLKLFYIIFCLFPIKEKKVVFASDSRSKLNGNFFFVYEELYKRNLSLDIKMIFNERINNKKTLLDLIKMAYEFATSKVIILDDFYPLIYPLKIRKKADLIQVWHAAGAFKTFGYSRIGRPGGPSPYSKNHRNYTKVVVSSEGVREHYAEGFGIPLDNVYATGVPRSDIFFDEKYKKYVKNTLKDKFPFLKEKKVILFAPTFRGNGQASAHYPFEILNLKKLYNALHKDYVFLFKIHPFVNNKLHIPYEYANFFYDFSDYREINDLLLITDVLITDYSSVCFEFALLDKPMLFFGFDVEKYIEDRDFYYDFFSFIPGPLVKTTEEIVCRIKNEEFQMEKIKPFVEYFFDNNLGNASENVIDQLIIPSLNNEDLDENDEDIIPPPATREELFERTLEDEE